ncbi:MAG: hypothetical protein ACPHJ3_07335, partial [Rubripirellula sp.]
APNWLQTRPHNLLKTTFFVVICLGQEVTPRNESLSLGGKPFGHTGNPRVLNTPKDVSRHSSQFW